MNDYYDYYSYSSPPAYNPVFTIISLVLCVFVLVCMWIIFRKAGKPGWAAIVPFYNLYVLFEITWGSGMRFLLLLIPIYNIILSIQTQVRLAKAFGKSGGFAAGLIFLPYIFIPLLAFGGTAYQGVPSRQPISPLVRTPPIPTTRTSSPASAISSPASPRVRTPSRSRLPTHRRSRLPTPRRSRLPTLRRSRPLPPPPFARPAAPKAPARSSARTAAHPCADHFPDRPCGRKINRYVNKERNSTMKKSITLVLAALMMLSLAACGGGSKDKGGALPGIDMKSTDTQTVTSDRATLEVLNETFFTYLGGLNYFTDSDPQAKLTYADLKEHIGVDCSEYQYQEEYQRGVYTWYAVEDEACCLSLFFGDNGKLMAAGAYNLSL